MSIPQWTDYFSSAVEPSAGWPPRPWDHRLIASGIPGHGPPMRVAVTPTGEVVLDADGDYVFTGPGVSYEVAKAVRRSVVDYALQPEPSWESIGTEISSLIAQARQESRYHGHTWVGEEHVVIAALQSGSGIAAALGPALSASTLEYAVAAFYDGPFAHDRIELVSNRRSSGWRPTPAMPGEVEPGLSSSVNEALLAIVATAGPGTSVGRVDLLDQFLQNGHPRPLVLYLLEQQGVPASSILEVWREFRSR